jgi:dsDNA-binding SOS-regulon protein
MAVVTKFVVVRKGEEKMTFANKKEADAYDKMLDMADAFSEWLLKSDLQLDDAAAENIALHLAEQKDAVQHILRTSKLPEAESIEQPVAETEEPAEPIDAEEATSSKKARSVKAA